MSQFKILSYGEVLYDVIGEKELIGGASFNLAAHATRCGLNAQLYSAIGADARGDVFLKELARMGVGTNWLAVDKTHPTGIVNVTLDMNGQPTYEIVEGAAWDFIPAPTPEQSAALKNYGFDVLCFGTLVQRSAVSRESLRALRAALKGVPVFYDVNIRPPFTPVETIKESLPGATIVKVNDDEAKFLSPHLFGKEYSLQDFGRALMDTYGVQVALLTRGPQGCMVMWEDGMADLPGLPGKVVSAVGAGDAFSAAFLASWLKGRGPAEAARRANELGTFIVMQIETVPEYTPELLAMLNAD